MGRKLRTSFPGAIHHVFTRGVNRGDIFLDDADRLYFMATLRAICSEGSAALIAYCLMTNHFHLVIKEGAVALCRIMQRLLTSYAGWCNRKYGRSGHLFEARYEANLCADDAYLRNLIRYVHCNPLKAGMVADPRDWKWSSAGEFGPDACLDPGDFDPWMREETAAILNREEAAVVRSIPDIAEQYCRSKGIPLAEITERSRKRSLVAVRKEIVSECLKEGHSMTSLSKYFEVSVNVVSYYCRSRP